MAGDTPAVREWAEQLVARAHAEGVELTGDEGLLTAMVRQVLQTGLEVELADHLGYEPHDPSGRGTGNSRNGTSRKTVTTDVGDVELRVPRDRNGTFDPQTVPKHQRRLDGLTGNVISLYAKGMTTGDIQAHLFEIYGTEISRETISKITDTIVEDMLAWQHRPLDRVYPVLLIDAIVIKVRDSQVANRPVYVVIGVNLDSDRDVLGLWLGAFVESDGSAQPLEPSQDVPIFQAGRPDKNQDARSPPCPATRSRSADALRDSAAPKCSQGTGADAAETFAELLERRRAIAPNRASRGPRDRAATPSPGGVHA